MTELLKHPMEDTVLNTIAEASIAASSVKWLEQLLSNAEMELTLHRDPEARKRAIKDCNQLRDAKDDAEARLKDKQTKMQLLLSDYGVFPRKTNLPHN